MAHIIILKKLRDKKEEKFHVIAKVDLKTHHLMHASTFKVESHLPIIDQILLSMKIRITAYDSLQSRFLFLMELNIPSNRVIKEIAKL